MNYEEINYEIIASNCFSTKLVDIFGKSVNPHLSLKGRKLGGSIEKTIKNVDELGRYSLEDLFRAGFQEDKIRQLFDIYAQLEHNISKKINIEEIISLKHQNTAINAFQEKFKKNSTPIGGSLFLLVIKDDGTKLAQKFRDITEFTYDDNGDILTLNSKRVRWSIQ